MKTTTPLRAEEDSKTITFPGGAVEVSRDERGALTVEVREEDGAVTRTLFSCRFDS